ncbi:DUF4349 domain-containing protein [Desulfosporosinus sp. PR]|uniref:DUF4349 domain-containing protein n=1 Tax=Candidatus Desulfosporosinus nitrosoreducens TaxID=3401928 RepID=UPI0027ED7733|nr:DUF4349 domain-containing protein [Desulfosporosinus sp. PR]MDQ7093440.1 DUF4349 domain-containing protein [Desulfosporosinus sp. PR]
MKSFKKKDLISLWEEDGDLEQMRAYFKAIRSESEINEQIKETIKQKALARMAAEEAKQPHAPLKKPLFERWRAKWFAVSLLSRRKLGAAVAGLILLLVVAQTALNFGHLFPSGGQATSQRQSSSMADKNSAYGQSSAGAALHAPKIAEQAPQTAVSGDNALNKAVIPHKITHDVTLTLEVTNPTDTLNQVKQKAEQMGGYIVESQQNGSAGQLSAQMTVKVPADKLDEFTNSFVSWGKVLDQHTAADDISNQYYDSQNRLQTLQAEENRYLEILNQAKTVDDILKVENALGNIRQQIEQLEGQLKLWNNQVDYSTVTFQFVANSSPNVTVKNSWQPVSWQKTWIAAQNACLKTISSSWNVLNYLAVGLGYVLPYLFLGLVGWAVYRIRKKK